MSDKDEFLTADIDSLMNDDIEPKAAPTDHDRMFAEYDKELMSFKPRRKRQSWPQPIRKR